MTDQSNPPKPPKGKSLFERAGDRFEMNGLNPAPVPQKLEPLPGAHLRTRQPKVAPAAQAPAAAPKPAPIVQAPVSEPQVAPPAPEPSASEKAQAEIAKPPPPAQQVPAAAVAFRGPEAKVDRHLLQEEGFIIPDGGVSTLLEEFRIVKRQLLMEARESLAGRGPANGQRILVCSPLPGEGKTFCATNLALALAAEKDSEVLLVDADFAKPSVLRVLGIGGEWPGFMDALANPDARVEDYVMPTDVHGLYVLPAGNRTNADSEFLASVRTAEVLDRLTQGAPNRMIIFDSPPALAASPAAELARHVGQILIVARADATGRSALDDAVALLSTSAVEPKLLLNAAHFSPSGRRFGTYYGTGGQS